MVCTPTISCSPGYTVTPLSHSTDRNLLALLYCTVRQLFSECALSEMYIYLYIKRILICRFRDLCRLLPGQGALH